jgi:hypothetical protein
MTIIWTLKDEEADFVLATLNGQPQNWTVMARAGLIQKLMEQAQHKQPEPIALPQKLGDSLLDGAGYGGTAQDGKPL